MVLSRKNTAQRYSRLWWGCVFTLIGMILVMTFAPASAEGMVLSMQAIGLACFPIVVGLLPVALSAFLSREGDGGLYLQFSMGAMTVGMFLPAIAHSSNGILGTLIQANELVMPLILYSVVAIGLTATKVAWSIGLFAPDDL